MKAEELKFIFKRVGTGLIIGVVLILVYGGILRFFALDGCIVEKHRFLFQEIKKDKLCKTEDRKCLFINTQKYIGECCGWSKTHTYYFASEKEKLNFSYGDGILLRWCDVKEFSPTTEYYVRGVKKE